MTHVLIGLVAISAFGAAKELPAWVAQDEGSYSGEYTNYTADGQMRFVASRIVLKHLPEGWSASYRSAVGMNGVETASSTIELKGVKVSAEGFSTDPVTKPKAWNGHLPASFSGRFVVIEPPKTKKPPKVPPKPKYGLMLTNKKYFSKR